MIFLYSKTRLLNLHRITKETKSVIALVLLCLVFFLLIGCNLTKTTNYGETTGYGETTRNGIPTDEGDETTVSIFDENYAAYSMILSQVLPNCKFEKSNRVFHSMESGASASEAFDVQALSTLGNNDLENNDFENNNFENNNNLFWYPHYLATVIIAVDRERTNANILSWSDLPAANEIVGVSGVLAKQMVFSAVAYGLEGENYSFSSAARLLAELRRNGRIEEQSFETPIIICYDFQAVAMCKEGRNLEIIVPHEGTISFERGLLSNTKLDFAHDIGPLLIDAGYRLLDGHCDVDIYPKAAAYEPALRISDYNRFNTMSLDSDRIFRRNVMGTRLYTSADGREHQFFALLYIILLIVWVASAFLRSMQKSVRRSLQIVGLILLGWIIVRLIKFQVPEETVLNRYLWYSYYVFQLALPLLALWFSWAVDRPDGKLLIPKWLLLLAMLYAVFLVFVLTNDLHNLVFKLDLNDVNWANDYSYGFLYWLVITAAYLPFAVAIVWMLFKSWSNPRKGGLVFPILFFLILILYSVGYVLRIPIARESDITMITGLLVLLFVEAMLRVGLMPANIKYTAFFAHSSLHMQLAGLDGTTSLASASAVTEYDNTLLADALNSYPAPLQHNTNTLLFAAKISGGNVIWEEDVTDLNRLHNQVQASVESLAVANAVLAEDEKIKRAISEESEKTRLMTLLEAEIAGHTQRLSVMAEQLSSPGNGRRENERFALLLNYVKRRCNLFFREQESQSVPNAEFTGYLNELAEVLVSSDVKIIVTNQYEVPLSPREATLFYDFFYSVIDWAAQQACPSIFAHLRSENETVIMKLIPVANTASYFLYPELSSRIITAGGTFAREDIDGAVVISLSFPDGGAVGG